MRKELDFVSLGHRVHDRLSKRVALPASGLPGWYPCPPFSVNNDWPATGSGRTHAPVPLVIVDTICRQAGRPVGSRIPPGMGLDPMVGPTGERQKGGRANYSHGKPWVSLAQHP